MGKQKQKKLPKSLLNDLKILSEKIKNPYFEQTIDKQLENFIETNMPLNSLERILKIRFGGEIGRPLAWVLNFSEKGFLDFKQDMEKSQVSQEVIEFVSKLSQKYEFYFAHYRLRSKIPYSIDIFSYDPSYDSEIGFILTTTLWRGSESFKIMGRPNAIVDLAHALLTSVEDGYTQLKQDIPELKLNMSKKDLDKIKNRVDKILSIIDEKDERNS